MCDGEKARGSVSRDTVRLGLTVTDVDMATGDVASEARTAFGTTFEDAVAEALDLSPDDIVIDTVAVASSSGTLRRWLQDLVDTAVSFTITTNSDDATAALLARIHDLRNASSTTIKVGDASTADTATFTQPVVISRDDPTGIECREGHDPDSPLCRVCLDGATNPCTGPVYATANYDAAAGTWTAMESGILDTNLNVGGTETLYVLVKVKPATEGSTITNTAGTHKWVAMAVAALPRIAVVLHALTARAAPTLRAPRVNPV